MTEKFKKIDREYVLSDSTVNEYGFRLLTEGYEIETYRKNPIGYYMHRREDGIALKWENLRIEDDKLLGTPVINLANPRGEQTLNEAENGFLNAASVGHIVVLEYSTDTTMMLPGQTGPTITRWYNKECSLVDIPGNSNALTTLYDAQENPMNLAGMMDGRCNAGEIIKPVLEQLAATLQLDGETTGPAITLAVTELKDKSKALKSEIARLLAEKQYLADRLEAFTASQAELEVSNLLNRSLEDGKITVELKVMLAKDYAKRPEALRGLLAAMPAYRSIASQISRKKAEDPATSWEWDDYEKNDPSGEQLKALRADKPDRYQELFEKKFAA